MSLVLRRVPALNDVRVQFFVLLCCYLTVGITYLGFNRTPAQLLVTVVSACLLDVIFHYILKRQWLFPFSAAITGVSLGILMNYSHGIWFSFVPVFFAISSKYMITFKNRHVFNPSLFGIVIALLISDGMISVAPSYQWGSSLAVVIFIISAALVVFLFKIKRTTLVVSFIILYAIALALRAWLTRWHIPPETLFFGTFSSPAFYLFTFFMITDPASSPSTGRGQFVMALVIVLIDLGLHKFQSYSTLFYSGFIYFSLRFIWIHIRNSYLTKQMPNILLGIKAILVSVCIAVPAWYTYHQWIMPFNRVNPKFRYAEVAAVEAGISSEPGNVLAQVDSRVAHVAKWLLSIGDAVAVADVNNDGLQDVFLSYPLKSSKDRAALYLNKGDFKFERFELPNLNKLVNHPETYGLPSGALWFDYDNDGDNDLLLLVSFGQVRLLKNLLIDSGVLSFQEVTQEAGLNGYYISLTANVLDVNRNGLLDLVIGNAMNPFLEGYDKTTVLNIFNLPQPMYQGDRRMFNFMHRSWYDADNGGNNYLFLNTGKTFNKIPSIKSGLKEHRWTLDIGTGDINGDGWTDMYFANDFGPDTLYINDQEGKFNSIKGVFSGSVGKDTYKGMNSSLGDIDNSGTLDIYVSNVHEKLQAEGSLLWMNSSYLNNISYKDFNDEAVSRNAINENRFGWGAAMGDINLDGYIDIVQANGMVDDEYDRQYEDCPDYWYWNAKIALTDPDIHGYADRWADLRGRCIFPYEKNRVYINNKDYFIDVADEVGLESLGNSRGVALVDLDNDGDLDMFITHQFKPVSIYRNEIEKTAWIGLELKGNGVQCNTNAIGSKVILNSTGSSEKQFREVQASNGFSAQGDNRILFGLSDHLGNVDISIDWCGIGKKQNIKLIPNQYHSISQAHD
jgi:Na+-translocating ferredoxin:NAD+ oxidoreductase RnfD subunit